MNDSNIPDASASSPRAQARIVAAAPALLASLQEILYHWANGSDDLETALRGSIDDAQRLVALLTAEGGAE